MRFTRIRASRTALFTTLLIAFAMISSMVANTLQREDASAQGVSWLSNDSISYLSSSSGIPVMVPSWLPGPVSGVTPEISASGGYYSIYFYSGSSFLYITGVAGGGFPGGSEANLNVELTVNANVQGWPAIQDIGIPEGSTTPIYDKVMWIADGVLYTVNGSGLDSDSLSLANSSVALYAPAPPVEEPVYEAPTEVPVYEEPVVDQPAVNQGDVSNSPSGETATETTSTNTTTTTSSDDPSSTTSADGSNTDVPTSDPGSETSVPTPTPAGSSDGTSGAWFTGELSDDPSDGTDGATPPFLGGDGTGGAP